MALISAPALNSRFTQLVVATTFLIGLAWIFVTSSGISQQLHVPDVSSWKPSTDTDRTPPSKPHYTHSKPAGEHPIDRLIAESQRDLDVLLQKETHTLRDAARAYRERRGRQPPPGFDKWFAFAQNRSALVVEVFFDQIYDDLNPFWGVPAKQIREQANTFIHRVSVRDGNVTQRTDIPQREWMDLWQDMVASIPAEGGWLPDVDLPINVMDESRMVVPWEEIDGYMAKEQSSRTILDSAELKTEYQSLRSLDEHVPEDFDPMFNGMGPYWPQAVVGCPPESPARKAYIETDFRMPPPLPSGFPDHSYEGYVQNWTLAKSPCENPSFQGLHGTFVEPISIANTKKYFPLFGGSKLPMNNEILLPPAMYWTDNPFYSGGAGHGEEWAAKQNKLIWRGSASGGRNKDENWTRFQRHRFISMVNATSVRLAEHGSTPPNFVLPAANVYELEAQKSNLPPGTMGDWVKTWSDAAAVHLLCFPNADNSPHCSYTDPYFFVEQAMPMKEQYSYKYLPDIDGNSFSGRYRGFLGSTSLPIKATIYNEWHDSRLIPWKHFVPMDNTFADVYGLMEYFVGNEIEGLEGHDEVAETIAMEGKAWAEKVLRREDMQIYVFRLLLEFARLCDDGRNIMGWSEGSGVT